jgi:hypothetical protein
MVRRSPSHQLVCLQFDSDATFVIVPRAPPTVVSPPVLRPDWEILARLASTWSKPIYPDVCTTPSHPSVDFVAQPTNRSLLSFEAPNCTFRFWDSNRETLHYLGFEAQPRNRRHRFWGQTRETVTTGFEAKTKKTVATDFEAKTEKTVIVILRPNHWQTVDLNFEAQPRNLRSSSPRARCRPYTVSLDLSITRPLITRPVRPSALGLLLLS